MRKNSLFPNKFKYVGFALFALSVILYVLTDTGVLDDNTVRFTTFVISQDPSFSMGGSTCSFDFNTKIGFYEKGMLDEIKTVMMLAGLLLASFSREKDEDECIASIRMRAFIWAIKLNTFLAILSIWFTFGLIYLYFMAVIFFVLQSLLFICKFHYELYKFRRSGNEE